MTKKVLCSLALAAALVSIFSLPVAAQDVKATSPVPAMTDRVLVPASPARYIAPMLVPRASVTPPSYCSPCLFYGGDLNPSAANAQGFANENTQPSVGLAATTYPAVHVPAGENWDVTGLITNNQSNNGGILDPDQATWSISKGVSSGNPGTTIASGAATASVGPTGRSVFGFTEYWVSVNFSPVHLNPGANYWISVVPQCTSTSDPACDTAEFFLSNTDETNAYPGPITGHTGLGFFNSSYFGFDYTPLCSVSADGCQYSSFGVIGTIGTGGSPVKK
jgi:hypothetical protein